MKSCHADKDLKNVSIICRNYVKLALVKLYHKCKDSLRFVGTNPDFGKSGAHNLCMVLNLYFWTE